MHGAAKLHVFPLPRSWPRRVRSAAVHVISLADIALTKSLSWAADSLNPRLCLQAELERFRRETSLLREEIRIKDARMEQIEPQKRPHYPPTERLAILELRAARHWSLAQAARTFLVTPLTLASWMGRLDEEGPNALIHLPEPVNRFPDFVAYLVKRLRVLCPRMGTVKMAQSLARAGLHLAPTTVRRMLRQDRRPVPVAPKIAPSRTITARRPNDLWHLDLTTVPTCLGFWIPWLPFALPQTWPFCWWVAVVVDHTSRRIMGYAVFRHQPRAVAARDFLKRLIRDMGRGPRHLVTDQGRQFIARTFKRWCRRQGVRQRFGAIGKYGSLAVIERCIRSLKTECTRRLTIVPYRLAAMERELAIYLSWYNEHRPHARLGGATPNEIYYRRRTAVRAPRFEPRPRWPRRSPCASPCTLIRGQPGALLDLDVGYLRRRRHLPIITLRRAP